jgi:hypothetical protein
VEKKDVIPVGLIVSFSVEKDELGRGELRKRPFWRSEVKNGLVVGSMVEVW